MKFDNIISDIQKLVGKDLCSIKPGANICITAVDLEQERISLTCTSGIKKSRPFEELRRIWERLCIDEVVHVDSVLGGSGTSRNQPETILANLPYVEWLILSNKKHLRFVGRESHKLGSLKQMDPVAVHQLKEELSQSSFSYPTSLLVVDNTKAYATWIESLTGVAPSVVSSGIYKFPQSSGEIWVTSSTSMSNALSLGTYTVIKILHAPNDSTEIIIGGRKFYLISIHGQNLLVYAK